jgi:HPt (histidine-containing phosphotransfer) domain-containing protein
VWDPQAALHGAGGDRELLQALARRFLEQVPHLLAEVHAAILLGDGRALERTAHQLKGAAAHFGARGVCSAAAELEVLGREGKLAGAATAYGALEQAVARLREALAEFTTGGRA